MVGFGSALRIARRAGWERAYLDYETLKLLLSQIEAIYEEEAHSMSHVEDDGPRVGANQNRRGRRKRRAGDYRDELFLESDSDLAFASSDDDLYGADPSMLSSDEETGEVTEQGRIVSTSALGSAGHAKPFTLSYSHEDVSSEEFDEDEDGAIGECAGGTFTRALRRGEKHAIVPHGASKPKKKNKRVDDATQFFVGELDFGEGNDEQAEDDTRPPRQSYSLLNTSFQRGSFSTSEQTALLPQAQSSTLYSFPTGADRTVTPPRDFSGGTSGVSWMTLGTNVGTFPKTSSNPPLPPRPPQTAAEIRRNKREQERRRKRRIRRRKRVAERKRQMEQRVPRHLRVAHGKARAITERFLGLLRAEVEKVTLFAQSRLGELADTAGSLRFPAYEDSEFGSFSESFPPRHPNGRAAPYEVLSDGGMHPSASSSEEEHIGGRRGPFPWSDTSDEEEMSEGGKNPLSPSYGRGIRKTYSGGAFSSTTEQRTNRTSKSGQQRQKQKSDTERPSGRGGMERDLTERKTLDAAQRQISHFEELRRKRPVFQRNDHIVGEDLLLLSAVDEADGYTAVGVELMHVLRFICVNVIAVRKICRKHDRLLANRMLGGYYHRQQRDDRVRKSKAAETSLDPITLGGILSTSALDDKQAETASGGSVQQNKLVGLFDSQIQNLANSTTVQVISSCLALALSEYEVSRSRADALARLNSSSNIAKTPHRRGNPGETRNEHIGKTVPFGLSPAGWVPKAYGYETRNIQNESLEETTSSLASHDEDGAGPPSTASKMSLTRLRFTVVSVFSLRKAALYKEDYYAAFLSRISLVFPGPIAEGLCSRETLDFFVAYNPDAALLLDPSSLHKGLRDGRWHDYPIESVMLSALATASTSSKPEFISDYTSVPEGTDVVMNALSITPDGDQITRLERASKDARGNGGSSKTLGGSEHVTLKLNRASLLLYTMNYYVTHPTANAFVVSTGAIAAHSASLIGAASIAAILSNMFHSFLMSRFTGGSKHGNLTVFRLPLIFSSFVPIWGNVLFTVATYRNSIPMAFGGRLLVGLGSSELLHRLVVLAHYLPDVHIMDESANLVKSQVLGVPLGIFLGTVLGSFDVDVNAFGRHIHVPSFALSSCLMSLLWFVQWIRLCFRFHEPKETRRLTEVDPNAIRESQKGSTIAFENYSSDSDSSLDHNLATPDSIFFTSSSEGTRDKLEAAYGAKKIAIDTLTPSKSISKEVRESLRTPIKEVLGHRRRKRGLKTFAGRLFNVMTYNVALPVSFFLVVLVKFAHEVFFTSCALIMRRYFGWNGSVAGLLLGGLSALVLPINGFCEKMSRKFDDRTVVKRSLAIVTAGLVIFVNWGSLFYIFSKAKKLFNEEPWPPVPPYDWIFGVYQYVVGFTVTFVGLAALEGTTLSLMSKVAPLKLRGSLISCGSIVTYLGLMARVAGDVQILMVGLSHRLINTDIVNSLVIPLIGVCLVAGFLVKKHFFFMI